MFMFKLDEILVKKNSGGMHVDIRIALKYFTIKDTLQPWLFVILQDSLSIHPRKQ